MSEYGISVRRTSLFGLDKLTLARIIVDRDGSCRYIACWECPLEGSQCSPSPKKRKERALAYVYEHTKSTINGKSNTV